MLIVILNFTSAKRYNRKRDFFEKWSTPLVYSTYYDKSAMFCDVL